MKTVVTILIIIGCSVSRSTTAQTHEATQLILNYEKLLQLEEILDNMYKGYKILSKGYKAIKDIAEGNFKIHKVFLDGLYAISPAVRNYKKIPLIIRYQQLLINESKRTYSRFKKDPYLTLHELEYIENVYSYILKQSLRNLDELLMIVTAGKLRMSDEERMQSIDRIHHDMETKLSFLKQFNNSTAGLIVQRAKEHRDIRTAQKLHDIIH